MNCHRPQTSLFRRKDARGRGCVAGIVAVAAVSRCRGARAKVIALDDPLWCPPLQHGPKVRVV
eukprot:9477878-Pyramimonas_sp.AAC.1